MTLEQPHAELGLEPSDLGRQSRLGNPQTLRRTREAALLMPPSLLARHKIARTDLEVAIPLAD
jgi:hypothetical protein